MSTFRLGKHEKWILRRCLQEGDSLRKWDVLKEHFRLVEETRKSNYTYSLIWKEFDKPFERVVSEMMNEGCSYHDILSAMNKATIFTRKELKPGHDEETTGRFIAGNCNEETHRKHNYAAVTYHNTRNTLLRKELITVKQRHYGNPLAREVITLTEKGKKIALNLKSNLRV